jgi:hypothetical protein
VNIVENEKIQVNSESEKTDRGTMLGANNAAKLSTETQGTAKTVEGKYRPYDPDLAKVAELLVAAGATQKKIAQVLSISICELRNWKKEHPEFKAALNRGKEETRSTLAFEGLKRAIGYTFEEYGEKPVKVKNKEGQWVYENHRYTYSKHQPGDPKLLIFMLECLDRKLGGDTWKTMQKLEIESKTLTGNQLEQAQSKHINDLAGKIMSLVAKREDAKIDEPIED